MDKLTTSIIGLTVVVLIGAAVLGSQSAGSTTTISADDPNRPIATISKSTFDMGSMAVTNEREQSVTVTNTGASPLRVGPASTSCDCTFARLTLPTGEISPEFSMHGMSKWSGELQPGQQAEVTITYRPSIMPVVGRVERSVLVQTNDPVSPTVQISFTATVE